MSGAEQLPDHPEEERLRESEDALAETIEELAGKVAAALRGHKRLDTIVLMTQLRDTAEYGRRAMKQAIDDQMKRASK